MSQLWLSTIGLTLIPGCLEYNRHQPTGEAESLSRITQLTDGFNRAGEAVFSADQRWIVFLASEQAKKPQPLQVYLSKLNWNEKELIGIDRPICITPAGSGNSSGSFSPDGTTLIFSSTAQAGAPQPTSGKFPAAMRIFRFDGWEGAIAMTDANHGADLAQLPLSTDRAYTGECSYSPDGRWICFTSSRSGQANLYVMHPDGSHIVQITKTAGYDGGATFSPDGRHLLYHSDRDATHLTQIFVADLLFDASREITGMTAEHQLTSEDNNTNPAWHPDGTHIIYTTSRHGRDNYELYLMNTLGRRKTRITFSPGADLFPVFSPDGRYLLWASKRSKDSTVQLFAAQFSFPRGS